jgi:Flp pilus assembly protein TadG
MIRKLCTMWRDNRGIAAIEMAFIMPLLLFLYFGLLDLTSLISLNRKVAYSASVVADLVTQNANAADNTKTTAASISDFFKASELVLKPLDINNVHIEVFQYRKISGAPVNQWHKASTGGTSCGSPSTSGMNNLMTDGNDVIVAMVCTTYSPYIANFLGKAILGATSFTLSEQIALRPRQASTLDCPTCT